MNPFFIIVFFVYFLINSYLFFRTWQAIPESPLLRTLYCIAYFIVFSSFVIAMMGRNVIPLGIQKGLYFIGTSWLGVMLYLTLFYLLTDLVWGANHFFHFIPSGVSTLLFHRIQVVAGFALVAVLLFVGHYRFNHPAVVEQELIIEKDGGNYDELKIAAFSDLHLGVAVDKNKLKEYVDFINRQRPDMILIAGDVVDNNLRPLFEEKMYEELNRLEAPLGIYFCPGNHEYISGIKESISFFDKTKIKVLVDSAVHVNDSFWVIGRDDRMNEGRLSVKELVSGVDTKQPVFLLDHQPYHLEEAEKARVDLQLSGHTHEGQLWPFNYVVNKIYEVGHGYKKKGNTHIYVSSGLALWGPEFRIGTQSELVVFNIKFQK